MKREKQKETGRETADDMNEVQESTYDDSRKPKKKKKDVPNEVNVEVDDEVVQKLFEVKKFSMRPVKQSKEKKNHKEGIAEDCNIKDNDSNDNFHPALKYLLHWHSNKDEWKFKKVRQIWLLQNIYDKEKISKEHFKIMLRYLSDMKGKSRESTILTAQNIVESETEVEKRRLKRATKVLKLLS